MQRQSFAQTGRSSLMKTKPAAEVPSAQIEKAALDAFKASTNLSKALFQERQPSKSNRVLANTAKELLKEVKLVKELQKQLPKPSEDAELEAEVAALNHYRPPAANDNTKGLVDKIVTGRRAKHITALQDFEADLDEYMSSVRDIYSAVRSEAVEFIKINDQDVTDYCKRLNDGYLMSKEKEVLSEIETEIRENSRRRKEKMQTVRSNLSTSENERTERIDGYCKALTDRLVESAFVLQEEASKISGEWKNKLNQSQLADEQTNSKFLEDLESSQQKKFEELRVELSEKQAKWKQLKQQHALEQFKADTFRPEYCNSDERKKLYLALKTHQSKIHGDRKSLVEQLCNADASHYTKAGVDKWLDKVKARNDESNAEIDRLVASLVQEGETAKQKGERRLERLRNRLNYIELLSPEENEKVLEERARPLLESNIQQGKKLLSDVTGYVEKYDSRENDVCENLAKFMIKLGQKNDENRKVGDSTLQSYELGKAKIADDDEEKVERLNSQLEQLKKELKQSLHHIKLEETEKKCFEKIDEIEQQYRAVHELNKQLAANHPKLIEKDMQKAESDAAEVFRLYDESKKNELIEKNKKEAEERAIKRVELEDKKKAEEEARVAEETKKKTGKAPPAPKPKDPKKAASEFEERKQAILKEMGPTQIKEFKTTSGKTWLIYQTIDDLATELYVFSQEKKQLESPEAGLEDSPPIALDHVETPVRDCENIEVVQSNVMFKKEYVVEKLTVIRDKMFVHIGDQKQLQLGKASESDKEFLEGSLEQLDTRLKAHYSLKGKLESEVYVRRATEITSHKKIYERHARTTKEKMDTQTEKFNYLLEKSLQLMKAHSEQQKKVREELPAAKNLSQLQGTAGRNRQNSQRFGLEIKQILNELQRLSTVEVQNLTSKNEQFLKECKQMSSGGEYSKEELEWYGQMMKEITGQLEQQKLKRTEKMTEIDVHTTKKKQEFLDAFGKEYNLCVEQLAAKDCSGKTYGKPKRYAQERVRGQMAKCEQAQVNLDKMVQQLATELERTSEQKSLSLQIRTKLMIIRRCIGRYAKHIEAFRPDSKLQEMPRVNYNESRVDTVLSGQQELDEDEKRKQLELEKLGQLSQQKEQSKFSQSIDDIEKVMKEQAQKLYVGDKAKYLNGTGTDRMPDFLRGYIANMKKNAETFRLNCIRELRATCLRLSDLSARITSSVLHRLQMYFGSKRRKDTLPEFTKFRQLLEQMEAAKSSNLKKLRPNLVNPACAQQLNDLDAAEKKRLTEFRQSIRKFREQILDSQFKAGSAFLTSILNNFEFLLQYYDSMVLEEDFIKLPGGIYDCDVDQSKEKKHLNLKELMLLKQKGQTFDPNSQRNITKKWQGVSYGMFDCPNRKFEYVKTAPQELKIDLKKAGKKQSKDPKQPPPTVEESQPGTTKELQSIKTERQKLAFEERNNMLEQFKKQFDKDLELFTKQFEAAEKGEQKFEERWNQTVESFKKGK